MSIELSERIRRNVHPNLDGWIVRLMTEAASEIERLDKLTGDFAKAIVEGDDAFPGDDWDDLMALAEKINPMPDDPDENG